MIRPGYTRKTQRESIKQFLQAGNSLTSLEALSLFGAYRLAAHIHILKTRDGMQIETKMGRDHNGLTYARYSLAKGTPMVPHHFSNGNLVPLNKMEPVYHA